MDVRQLLPWLGCSSLVGLTWLAHGCGAIAQASEVNPTSIYQTGYEQGKWIISASNLLGQPTSDSFLLQGSHFPQHLSQAILQPLLSAPETITVSRFEVEGSTIFSPETLAEATRSLTNRPLSFAELLQAAEIITKLYTDQGYLSSGAFIPANQTFLSEGGVVKIQVLEGSLEKIEVIGTQRLDPGYIRSRLAIAAGPPLNIDRLLQALQVLKVDPLLANISGELSASSTPGKSILTVNVTEAKTFRTQVGLDNSRSPGVGTWQRQVALNQANLLGIGDAVGLTYSNTDGSNGLEVSYQVPISPYNTTVRFLYSMASSQVIEDPFSVLDITAASRVYDLSLRQPLLKTPAQEIAVGLALNRQESETALLGFPFPLATGANDRGETRLTTLRLTQEFTQQGNQDVIAAYSQFSIGMDWLGTTVNQNPPDSRFLSWRGQAQYVRLLAPDTLMLLRSDVQLADRPLVPLEQISLGGPSTVRGYRRDYLVSDNGAFLSSEFRVPVLRVPEVDGILQLTPFIDAGLSWNTNRPDPNPNTLLSSGLGLLWRQGDYLVVRFQWGIPILSIPATRRTWQENGLYFSIVYTPFTF